MASLMTQRRRARQADYMRAKRDRLKEEGRKGVIVYLTPEEMARLDAYVKQIGAANRTEAMESLIEQLPDPAPQADP
jgi:hypothetical protein